MNHDEMDELPATEEPNKSASEPTQQEITNDRSARALKMSIIWLTVFIGCIVMLGYIVFNNPVPPRPPLPQPPTWNNRDRETFFNEQVDPAIAEADQRNRAAAALCVDRIKGLFRGYRNNVPKFTDDMTSYGTRFAIMYRMPGDWWNESNKVNRYVTQKFETQLFSQQKLEEGLEEALAAFATDIQANNAQLLTSVKAAIRSSDLPNLPTINYGQYTEDLSQTLNAYSNETANKTVLRFVLTEITAGTLGMAVEQLLVNAMAYFATTTATTATAAGGATAASSAAGGAGGTTVGPWGTVVGFGVGLVIGLAIDWWMSEEFAAKLNGKLTTMLNQTEDAILQGAPDRAGLEEKLETTCRALHEAYEKTLRDRILGGAI
jgi:hypothetical protein